MSWIALSILAAFLWAASNIVDKYLLGKLVRNALLPVIVLGIVGLAASALVFFIQGFDSLSLPHAALAIFAGVMYIVMVYCYYYALQSEDVSKVIPLFYFGPLFIAIGAAVFLGEIFTPLKYLGIAALIAGAMLISWNRTTGFTFGRALGLMIGASIAMAFTQVVSKYLLGYVDFWTVFSYVRLGAFFAVVPLLIANFSSLLDLYREKGKLPFVWMFISETLNNVATLLFTLAVAIGFVTLANALTSIQPFFVLLIAVAISVFFPQILKEELGKSVVAIKVIAIATMFVGALLIS